MENFKISISKLVAGVCLALFASCVEETPDEFTQAALGYIEQRQDLQKNVLMAVDGFAYHAPDFESPEVYPDQSKWMIYCKVSEVDSVAKTKEVTFFSEPIRFVDESFTQSADTVIIRDNEQPVQSLTLTAKVKDGLCVSSVHLNGNGEENRLEVFYTEKDTLVEFNDCNVYTVYLRSYQEAAPTDTLPPQKITRHSAYDLSSFLAEKKKVEAEKGKDAFYLRLKYITSITRTPKEPELPEEPEQPEQPDQPDEGDTPSSASVKADAVEMVVTTQVYEPGEEDYILIPVTAL